MRVDVRNLCVILARFPYGQVTLKKVSLYSETRLKSALRQSLLGRVVSAGLFLDISGKVALFTMEIKANVLLLSSE
jgi:hypothetical protein